MTYSITRPFYFFAFMLMATINLAQSNTNFSQEEYFMEGLRLHERGDYSDAIEYYNVSITMNPGCIKCLYNRGLAFSELEKHNKALADFNRLLQINPVDIDAYEQRGHLRYVTGDTEGAIADFSTVISSQPTATAYTNRGMAYLDLQQYQSAIKDLENGIQLDKLDGVAHRTLGDVFVTINQVEKAIGEYTKAIDINDRDIIALNNRGNAYQLTGQDDRALQDYNQGIALLENSFTYTNRAKYWIKKENYDQALIDSRAATKLDFNNAEAYYCVGLIENVRNNYEIAANNFNKAIALDDKQSLYYNGRGLALFQLGEFEDALSDFESAVLLNPADAAAKDRIADCHYKLQGSNTNATAQTEEEKDEFTERGIALVEYGILVPPENQRIEKNDIKIDQTPKPEIFYERSVAAFALVNENTTTSAKDNAIQLMDHGDEYLNLKWYDQAILQFTAAIDSDPFLADAYYKRAQSYMLINELEQAIADLDQYLFLNPQDVNAYNDRGTLRFRTGNVFGAQEDYNKGIIIDSKHALLRSNRGRWNIHMNYFEAAVYDFTAALQNEQHDASIYYQRGLAFFELKEYQKVTLDMNQAIAESSIDRYEYYFLSAKALLFSARNADALDYFDKTISLSPRFAEAYMYRAVTKQQLNDTEGACADYHMATALGYKAINGTYVNRYCQEEEEETARISHK